MTAELSFEDFEVGTHRELGSFVLDEAEIIAFAERYDPQPFHVDPAAAEDSMFGGLVASGWHTAASCMRVLVDGLVGRTDSMGASRLERLEWSAPVRPGDVITVENEILAVRASRSRDDRGYVRNETVGRHEGARVISWVGVNIVGRRDG